MTTKVDFLTTMTTKDFLTKFLVDNHDNQGFFAWLSGLVVGFFINNHYLIDLDNHDNQKKGKEV